MKDTLNALKEFICHNQKMIMRYEYFISETHRKVRELVDNQDPQAKEKAIKFMQDSIFQLIKSIESNENLIENIFNSFDLTDSRITVKTILGDNVLSIYRNTNKTNFTQNKVSQNTGFDSILNHGQPYFLSNNLSEDYKSGLYKNPRLNKERTKLFINGKLEWKDCWEAPEEDLKNRTVEYYESTLIIPMSISKKNEDIEQYPDFSKHYFEDGSERAIWGFLCFDSTKQDYFKEKEKEAINAGTIIADTLSHYLIHFYNHVTASRTIEKLLSNPADR